MTLDHCLEFENEVYKPYRDDVEMYLIEGDTIHINRCQKTCAEYRRPSCPNFYRDADCYCQPGFAREFLGGKCISITDPKCSSQFPPNEGLF